MRFVTLCLLAGCGTEISVRTDPSDPPAPDDGTIDDLTPPEAVCKAEPNPAVPLGEVDLIGENSYDPDTNTLINYRWSLVRAPAGSEASLPSGQANLPGFLPDMVGAYLLSLVVTDASGKQSQPCAVDLDVTPSHKLWLELTWAYDKEDLDLHLVRGEAASAEAAVDCSAAGCAGDWGTPGDPTDDPELVRDDVEGTGPELIGVMAPEDDEVFTVWVLDRQQRLRSADNTAVLQVHLDGRTTTISRVFSEEPRAETPRYWVGFARIDVGAGTVTEL